MKINFNFTESNPKESFFIKNNVLGKLFLVDPEERFYLIKNNGNTFILEGDLFYFSDGSRLEYLSDKTEEFINNFLTEIIGKQGWEYCKKHLEGKYISLIFSGSHFQLEGNKLKQKEIFYFQDDSKFLASCNLSDVTQKINCLSYDQNIIASVLASSYQYSPAKHTIYKDVYSLASDEVVQYSRSGFKKFVEPDLKDIENYGPDKLQDYAEILDRAILGRSSSLNISNNSGGWDCTYVIGALVDLLGRDRVKSSTFNSILRNGRSWNFHEKTKAEKIAEYFGIENIEVSVDLKSFSITDSLLELLPELKSRNTYIGALPHFLMYKKLKEYFPAGTTVFSGEASDSLHNFGFSQYMSFFHESYPFKEYGDKMKNYLYGPEFFKKLKSGLFKSDKVFQIWKSICKNTVEEPVNVSEGEFIFRYLSPLILGEQRIPFENVLTAPNLTERGIENLIEFFKNHYFIDIINQINEKNCYSCFTYLYKQFHLQGPTIKMIPIATNFHGFKSAIPFLDSNVVEFLEKMPESWGRGLEFNNTKYPLKESARKRNFPVDIVEKGIHSYPSEVDPTLKNESYNLYFNSTITNYYKEIMSNHRYREILSGDYFNLPAIKKDVDNFLNDRMDKVADYKPLMRLINFVSIGWY